ncbi:hypothetical protein BUALT_Bualt14G0052400 [Buddleja alternifolia]|uniref:Uncharacterized protein n=1 Tax=Buddleja alternifolia TaxID=168488 RepID=A0AAV6WGE4_9LAMI|nr:hypothetical protein BUALT_Bualt14G0052400 [Buddleja alternifolia]
MEMSVDPLEHELDDMDLENELDHDVEFIETVETSHEWSSWRDSLATSMYNEWRDRAAGEHAEDFVEAINQVLGGTDTTQVEKQNEEDLEHQFEGLGGFADETETMSACPTNSSTSGKKSKGKKRKSMDGQDPMYQLMGTFCQNTDVRLGEIAQRIGYDYDVSKARKEIYGVVGKIEGLSLQHKLKVSRLLAKNTEDLELFLSLDDVGKTEFVQMTLGGQF